MYAYARHEARGNHDIDVVSEVIYQEGKAYQLIDEGKLNKFIRFYLITIANMVLNSFCTLLSPRSTPLFPLLDNDFNVVYNHKKRGRYDPRHFK
jgi:hypothetical protein